MTGEFHLVAKTVIPDNFKSLVDKEKDKKEKEEDKEFEAQRQASIAEALQAKGGEKKTFGGAAKVG